MSRAFVKEVEQEIDDLPDRPVPMHPNLVTAEGLAAVERTLSRFEAANKAAIAKNDQTAIAAFQRRDGRAQKFRIVGEGEADPARGSISYVSPLARAVLGGKLGDTVEVPGGDDHYGNRVTRKLVQNRSLTARADTVEPCGA